MAGFIQEVPQKFCIIRPFSTCGDTVAPKLHAHVTEGIPSTRANFCSNKLGSDEKNNDGSGTDSCAQGQATKCYLVFNARICFG